MCHKCCGPPWWVWWCTELAGCTQVGDLLLERMRGLQQKHSIIGDVRGQGLMLGVEMVKDQASKEPATAETAQASKCSASFLMQQAHAAAAHPA